MDAKTEEEKFHIQSAMEVRLDRIDSVSSAIRDIEFDMEQHENELYKLRLVLHEYVIDHRDSIKRLDELETELRRLCGGDAVDRFYNNHRRPKPQQSNKTE